MAPRRQAYGGVSTMHMMPVAPTDATARGMAIFPTAPTDTRLDPSMPVSPTAGGASPYGYGGGQAMNRPMRPGGMAGGGFGGSRLPPPMPQAYSQQFSSLESRNSPIRAAQIGGAAGSAPPTKAFAGVQRPPAISPYMQLYQQNTAGGTVDPYTTSILPQLNQMQQNQQNANDINNLQTQVAPLVAPPQTQPQNQEVMPTPQYNLNYQDYPPANGQYGPQP